MKNYFTKPAAKIQEAMRSIAILIFVALLSQQAAAQCTGCTATTSTNANMTFSSGVNCLTYSGTYGNPTARTITMSGGTLCISSATNWNSATLALSGSGTINNYGTSNKNFTLPPGYTFNNYGTYSGTLTQNAGSTVNNYSTWSGSLTQTASGAAFNNMSGGTVSGTSTVKGTFVNGGSVTNAIITNTSGALTNNNSISGALTIPSGTTFDNYGTFTNTINMGGTTINYSGGSFTPSSFSMTAGSFTNNASGTVTLGAVTVSSGCTITNNGTMNASSLTVAAGGVMSNSYVLTMSGNTSLGNSFTNTGNLNTAAFSVTAGTTTNSGAINIGTTLSLSSGATITNNGFIGVTGTSTVAGTLNSTDSLIMAGALTISTGALTNGSIMSVTGAAVLNSSSGSLTNNGTLTMGWDSLSNGTQTNNGNITMSRLGLSGGTMNFAGNTQTVNGHVSNKATIKLDGNLTITGTYSDGLGVGTVKATGSGSQCNLLNIATMNNGATYTGTFDGNSVGLTLTNAVPTLFPGRMTNGATGPVTTPGVQGNSFSSSSAYIGSNPIINASFTAPAGVSGGFIVLRYVGVAATSDAPTDNVLYAIGGTIGSSTIVAMPTAAAGTKNFADTLTSAACGQTVYYRIFSYNGTLACKDFYTTSPLTGSVAMTLPPAAIGASGPTSFCTPGSVTLTASGGGTYSWNSPVTSAVSISPTTSNTYIVTVTAANGCTDTALSVVTANTTPTATITPTGSTTVCTPATVTLTASGAANFLWSTGATTAAIAPGTTGTYTVTVSTAAGCSATANRSITVNTTPAGGITASGPTTFCVPGSVTLTANGTGTYLWSTGATTSGITVNSSATYRVTVTGAVGGCTVSASQVVTANPLPTPTVNSAVSCSGASVTLTATGGATYLWSTGATTTSISTATVGTYTVTATTGAGCTATASGTVTASNPVATTNNPAVCTPTVATMTATGGTSYLWSTGSTTDTIRTATAGVYSVTATDAVGCTATASGVVTVNITPTATSTNAGICAGSVATLTAGGGVVYSWSNGQATANMTTTTAGTYIVTVTSMGSCTATASGVVTVAANPTPSIAAGVICSGVATTLTASGGTSYVWSTGQTSASITSGTTSSTYTVTATNGSGCTASVSKTTTTGTNPTPSISNPTPTICVGQSATLTASGGTSYAWSTSAATAGITVSPVTTTTYTVTATNAATCTASVSASVTVNALPTPTATGGNICTGTPTDNAVLVATGGGTYAWSGGTATTSASNPVSVAGTYTVTVTNGFGCTASASCVATSSAKPTPTVNSPNVCFGVSSTLTATGGGTYLWSPAGGSATTAAISVTPPVGTNTYSVTVTSAAGCTAAVTSTVTVYSLPTTTIGSNTPVLLGATINLTCTPSGSTSYTYAWSGPSSFSSTSQAPSIAGAGPTNGGIYYLTVTDNHSCTVGANTTLILNYSAPGGVASNTALWLRGGSGVATTGSNVTAWNDQSQLGNNSVLSGTNPTLLTNSLNTYPVVNFGGAGGLLGTFGTTITSTAVSSFVVENISAGTANTSGIFTITAGAAVADSTTTTGAVLFARTGNNSISSFRNSAIQGTTGTSVGGAGAYHILSSIFGSTSNRDSFNVDGRASFSTGYPAAAFAATKYTVGARMGATGAGKYMTGQIAEVALFNRQLSNQERAQVESYLAIKYGLTLDQTSPGQNYIESNNVIFWNATSNGAYKNNIFGIGADNTDSLRMLSSVSVNTAQLSISVASALPYYSYIMVSDNAAGATLTATAGLPNKINAKMLTVWRASQTGIRTTTSYAFNTSLMSFGNYAPIASSMTPYMVADTNADGTYETYIAASSVVGSVVTFAANLRDGTLFSLGYKASIDYGDAFGLPTTSANNGAGHLITSTYLGTKVDAEIDGLTSATGVGDDNDSLGIVVTGAGDEDGVNFNIGVPTSVNIVQIGGVANQITVTAHGAGYLNAWIDNNQNGTFDAGTEYAIRNVALVNGANSITFYVSDSAEYGKTFMRFRFAAGSTDVTAATGLATNGEVEDYQVYLTAPLVGNCTNGFQNPDFEVGPAPSSGLGYIITSETNLSFWRTTAPDKMIEMWHSGFLSVPAYSGTYFMELEANMLGALYQDVYTTPGATLIWSFAHRGRSGVDTCNLKIGAPGATVTIKTVGDGTSAWGVYNGTYIVPSGQYITRFEFNALYCASGDLSVGNFLDKVSVATSFDYGDAPSSYSTTLAQNGPYHALTGTLYLGAGISCDNDGTIDANAAADANDDGITFPTPCASCTTDTVSITAFNNSGQTATIAGWIDFNKNGIFETSERKSVNIPTSASPQTVKLIYTVTSFASNQPYTFGRFRIANDSTEVATPYGLAKTGEVEDYKIPCIGLPTPIPTATGNPACARGPVVLSSTGTAPYYTWSGPNSYSSSTQNPTISSLALSDSGWYRVYAIYANGCVLDSAVKVRVQECYVTVAGNMLDDANGNGTKDGVEATSNRGQTLYAILSNSSNTILAQSSVAIDGSFSFASVPAYTSSMTIVPSTVSQTPGATSAGPSWPSNWVGTKSQYGTNNNAGSGVYNTPNIVPISADIKNISTIYMGYDRLPTSVNKTYTISHPHRNSYFGITPANGLGMFSGSDPEDGSFTSGSTFTITSLAGLNGNKLFYDANGDGLLQVYEEITGYTVIANVDPTKFMIKYSGAGSASMSFRYASTDAASQVDPAPALYTISWNQPLPVKLISFTGDKYNETQSILKWTTASEINNDHFEIERSADAEQWEKIGEVKGNGNTNETINYSLVDEHPLTGTNYYRLKQVDYDGQFEYSDMVQVDFGSIERHNTAAITQMSLYPNPLSTGKGLNIKLSGDDNIKQIRITNVSGQVVYTNDLYEIQSYEIQGLDLASGIYMVNVVSESNKTFTGKIIIQK